MIRKKTKKKRKLQEEILTKLQSKVQIIHYLCKGNIKKNKVFFVKNISVMIILKIKTDKERYRNSTVECEQDTQGHDNQETKWEHQPEKINKKFYEIFTNFQHLHLEKVFSNQPCE